VKKRGERLDGTATYSPFLKIALKNARSNAIERARRRWLLRSVRTAGIADDLGITLGHVTHATAGYSAAGMTEGLSGGRGEW
jgi:hypothetical protein